MLAHALLSAVLTLRGGPPAADEANTPPPPPPLAARCGRDSPRSRSRGDSSCGRWGPFERGVDMPSIMPCHGGRSVIATLPPERTNQRTAFSFDVSLRRLALGLGALASRRLLLQRKSRVQQRMPKLPILLSKIGV